MTFTDIRRVASRSNGWMKGVTTPLVAGSMITSAECGTGADAGLKTGGAAVGGVAPSISGVAMSKAQSGERAATSLMAASSFAP
jgi:hypothetical protein